jgi:hypothetical protein
MKFRGFFDRKKPFEREADELYERKIGKLRVERGEGFDLVRFNGDLETYRTIQTIANKAKIDWLSVAPDEIAYLCRKLTEAGVRLSAVLCHGTRNASEQKFFREQLPQAEILGTEISDTAAQFPMTIQWDFHEVKPEWLGHFDLVFSNSWDHTYDPDTLFPAWFSCIAPNGALVLEWSSIHTKTSPDAIDPFRASLKALTAMLTRHSKGLGFAAPTVAADLPVNKRDKCYVIVRRTAH